jgi:hypothetical protein
LKFLVHYIFHDMNHFHQSHLSPISDRHEWKLMDFKIHLSTW